MISTAAFRERSLPSKTVLNATTAIVILACGSALLAGPLRSLRDSRRARIGLQVVTPADSITDMRGVAHPLLGRDSLTMLVFADATCAGCRHNVKSYVAVGKYAALQGVAFRLLSAERSAATPLDSGGNTENAFMVSGRGLFERLGMHAFPSTLFIDRTGVVRGRLIGTVAPELRILNTVDAVEH